MFQFIRCVPNPLKKKIFLTSILISNCLGFATAASLESPERFVKRMEKEHAFDGKSLLQTLKATKVRQDIIDAMNRPAEAMPWHKYRKIWMKEARIEAGLAFWKAHESTLLKAEKQFGVAKEIIVGILGVETYYGKIQGKFPVLEALNTLAFHYPKRAAFFNQELEQYLLLAREQGWSLDEPLGSYAGAMGMGQFISSSYRHYAVDFNGDGKINLFSDPEDAIGSVANYFSKHRWKLGEPVVVPAKVPFKTIGDFADKNLQPVHSWGKVQSAGVEVEMTVDDKAKVAIYPFEQENGWDFWLGFDNFYVITRYNRSPLYALAVFQFSEAVKQEFSETQPN